MSDKGRYKGSRFGLSLLRQLIVCLGSTVEHPAYFPSENAKTQQLDWFSPFYSKATCFYLKYILREVTYLNFWIEVVFKWLLKYKSRITHALLLWERELIHAKLLSSAPSKENVTPCIKSNPSDKQISQFSVSMSNLLNLIIQKNENHLILAKNWQIMC